MGRVDETGGRMQAASRDRADPPFDPAQRPFRLRLLRYALVLCLRRIGRLALDLARHLAGGCFRQLHILPDQRLVWIVTGHLIHPKPFLAQIDTTRQRSCYLIVTNPEAKIKYLYMSNCYSSPSHTFAHRRIRSSRMALGARPVSRLWTTSGRRAASGTEGGGGRSLR